MKHSIFILSFFLSIVFQACNNNVEIENQVEKLSKQEVYDFKKSLIRYVAKLPTEISQKTKFESYFDDYYEEQIPKFDLEKYYKSKDGKEFFLFTRIAPSIKLKKVAIGGYVKFDENGEVLQLNEVFRTWKKEPEELSPVAYMLFEKMIAGKDLSMYYPENSGEEEIIEFPNSEVYYDTTNFYWISTRENPLEEYYQVKANRIEEVIKEKHNENN